MTSQNATEPKTNPYTPQKKTADIMDTKVKIDFLVIGAQKSGTTSLHEILARQGQITLPKMKETHFFSHAERRDLGLDWYLSQFSTVEHQVLRGEVDPEYLYSQVAAFQIRELTTVDKFVVILRNPLDRAFSQFQMSLRRGFESLSFGQALRAEPNRLSGKNSHFAFLHQSYALRSMYSQHILHYMEAFPSSNFLFIRSDDLSVSGLQQIFEFIGVEQPKNIDLSTVRANTATQVRSRALANFLYAPKGKSFIRKNLLALIPHFIKRQVFISVDTWNQKPSTFSYNQFIKETPKCVLRDLASDLEKTEELTGLTLTDWRVDMERHL